MDDNRGFPHTPFMGDGPAHSQGGRATMHGARRQRAGHPRTPLATQPVETAKRRKNSSMREEKENWLHHKAPHLFGGAGSPNGGSYQPGGAPPVQGVYPSPSQHYTSPHRPYVFPTPVPGTHPLLPRPQNSPYTSTNAYSHPWAPSSEPYIDHNGNCVHRGTITHAPHAPGVPCTNQHGPFIPPNSSFISPHYAQQLTFAPQFVQSACASPFPPYLGMYAPAYHGLSPPPPVYQNVDPSTLSPGADVKVNMWKRESRLYDNYKNPHILNTVRTSLRINPVIAFGEGEDEQGTPLLVDLGRVAGDITTLGEPGTVWDDEDARAEPATLPRVTKLRIVSPKMRWDLDIHRPGGVTVGHVLDELCKHFNRAIEHPVWESLPEDEKKIARDAYWINLQYRSPGQPKVPVRRVDFLGSEPIFDGLRADPDYIDDTYGDVDPAVLVLNLKNRSPDWYSNHHHHDSFYGQNLQNMERKPVLKLAKKKTVGEKSHMPIIPWDVRPRHHRMLYRFDLFRGIRDISRRLLQPS